MVASTSVVSAGHAIGPAYRSHGAVEADVTAITKMSNWHQCEGLGAKNADATRRLCAEWRPRRLAGLGGSVHLNPQAGRKLGEVGVRGAARYSPFAHRACVHQPLFSDETHASIACWCQIPAIRPVMLSHASAFDQLCVLLQSGQLARLTMNGNCSKL
jgi:hypothetical protein